MCLKRKKELQRARRSIKLSDASQRLADDSRKRSSSENENRKFSALEVGIRESSVGESRVVGEGCDNRAFTGGVCNGDVLHRYKHIEEEDAGLHMDEIPSHGDLKRLEDNVERGSESDGNNNNDNNNNNNNRRVSFNISNEENGDINNNNNNNINNNDNNNNNENNNLGNHITGKRRKDKGDLICNETNLCNAIYA